MQAPEPTNPPNRNYQHEVYGGVEDAGFGKTIAHKVVNSANASAGIDITDAPATGQKRALVDLLISTGSADLTVTITEETSGTVMHGPFYLPANTIIQITTRATPMSKLATANKKYRLTTNQAGNITVETWSYSEV